MMGLCIFCTTLKIHLVNLTLKQHKCVILFFLPFKMRSQEFFALVATGNARMVTGQAMPSTMVTPQTTVCKASANPPPHCRDQLQPQPLGSNRDGATIVVIESSSSRNSQSPPLSEKDKQIVMIANIISLLLGGWAVYLSWTCNTLKGVSTGMKVLYAFFAFLFGPFYLLYYLIANRGECNLLKQSQQQQVGAAAAATQFYYL